MVLVHLRAVIYEPHEVLLSNMVFAIPDIVFAAEVSLESRLDFSQSLNHACFGRLEDALSYHVPRSRLGGFTARYSIQWDNTGVPQIDQSSDANVELTQLRIEDLRLQFEMIARRQYRDCVLVLMKTRTWQEPKPQPADNTRAWQEPKSQHAENNTAFCGDLTEINESGGISGYNQRAETPVDTNVQGNNEAGRKIFKLAPIAPITTGSSTEPEESSPQPSVFSPSWSKNKGKGKATK